ncbi:hypothetical protein BAE44_0011061, partial [Dichanthelium oligosanthes]
LRSDAGGRSTIAGLWHQIQELGRPFLCFKILHVRREASVAAHRCAQVPTPGVPVCNWIDHTPDWLKEIVILLDK